MSQPDRAASNVGSSTPRCNETPESLAASTRKALEAAHCVESFSVLVHGATAANGDRAVILAVLPVGERGWTFPLPATEARRIASMLIERADDVL